MSYETSLLNHEVYTYEYFQQENVCRLCWNQQGVHGLFTRQTENRNDNEPLAVLIRNCLNIEIKEDSFPKNVCGLCCIKVEEYSKFKSFCSETHKRLEAILSNVFNSAASSIKVKVENIDEGLPVLSSQPNEPLTIKLEHAPNVSDHNYDNENSDNLSMELSETIFQCDKCYLLFMTEQCLNEHMVTHYRQENYICEVCSRVFYEQDSLHKHKLTHNQTKHFICSLCGYQTLQKSSFTAHRTMHHGERTCPQGSRVRAHARTRYEQRMFLCRVCDKRFSQQDSLKSHVSAVHERSGQKSRRCGYCGATFLKQPALLRHLLAKHPKRDTAQLPIDGATSREEKVFPSPVFLKVEKSEDDMKPLLEHCEVHTYSQQHIGLLQSVKFLQ